MRTGRTTLGASASTAISKYMDGKISSKEYFREVRESTTKEVRRELNKETEKGDKG